MENVRVLTDEEIQQSLDFADGALALAGHFVTDPASTEDIRQMLRGEITADEAIERAYQRVVNSSVPRGQDAE